jgi:ribosomal-protein-alanine N-acetyltransferase
MLSTAGTIIARMQYMETTKVRWLCKRDHDAVLDIDRRVFQFPITRHELETKLRKRSTIGMVAEYDGRVVGHMIYNLERTAIRLDEIAVHPEDQRTGVGRLMMEKLKSKLIGKRVSIACAVRETNVVGQLFFKEMEFDCVQIIRGHYGEMTDDDAYVFLHELAIEAH